jgi:hypothetical protein
MKRPLTLALVFVALSGTPAFAWPWDSRAPATPMESLARSIGPVPMPGRVAKVGEYFLGTPYMPGTLDKGKGENVVCRLDGFDCVTFVETSVAIARAAFLGPLTQTTAAAQLESLRYRGGELDGYGSRLHYFSDWIADNQKRGNVKDLTRALGGILDDRPIHFMSAHRASYLMLSDEKAFASIVSAEASINARPRYYLPKTKLSSILPLLQSGDIVAITTNIPGLDVVHTGLIDRLPDGSIHLLHAPEPGSKVQISTKTLVDYLQGFSAHTGVIIARPLPPR